MLDLLQCLKPDERRGSKPRCHLMTHGAPEEVAATLTRLIEPYGEVRFDDNWMPQGFDNLEEAELQEAPRLLPKSVRIELRHRWLAVKAKTPNWDIASTCTIGLKKGLLLVEAKAHDAELMGEGKGRSLDISASTDRALNHEQIAKAIAQANAALNNARPGWNLSLDSRYQMVNRFAWSWKLTELGFPVVLVYLGFLKANEMADRGKPFASAEEWNAVVLSHSQSLFPGTIRNQPLPLRQAFIPLIQSVELPLVGPNTLK
jgi:hypothetical protein